MELERRRLCTCTCLLVLMLMVSNVICQQCLCTPPCEEDHRVTLGLCPMNRTIARSDCDCCTNSNALLCAGQAGHTCDGHLQLCDAPLGLQCDPFSSTCQGSLGIQVLETTHNSTVIRWRTELDEPMSNFVLLTKYQDHQEPDNETQWDSPPITSSSDGTVAVGGLRSSSVYFVKVVDERSNKSETVIIQTHDGCQSNETRYGVGETFNVGCQERCLCSDGGIARCQARCKVAHEMLDHSSTSLHSSTSSASCRTMADPDDPACCLLLTCVEKAMGPVGDPKVIVTGKTPSSLALAWDDFKAPNYNRGYVVEYRTAAEHANEQWQRIQASNAPNATIFNLKPRTSYHIRVAVWEDYESQRLGAWTEAMSSSTDDGCEWENNTYHVGEIYSKGCEEKCTCAANGTTECGMDICSLPYHKIGSFAEDELCFETPSGEDPCCVLVACASNKQPTTKIKPDAVKFSIGECPAFVPDLLGSCKSTCKTDNDCQGNKCCLTNCGSTVCVPPVKPFGVVKKPSALKEGCTSGGTIYAVDEEFGNGCQLKCKCLDVEGKYEIHCQPRCPMIQEKHRALKDPSCRMLPDPQDECCKVLVCDASEEPSTEEGFFENDTEGDHVRKEVWKALTPHPPPSTCLYKNKTYEVDEHFEDECESKCHCLPDGQVQCIPRCDALEVEDGCFSSPSPIDPCCEIVICANTTVAPEKPRSLENDTVVNETATKMLNTTEVEELLNSTTTEATIWDNENITSTSNFTFTNPRHENITSNFTFTNSTSFNDTDTLEIEGRSVGNDTQADFEDGGNLTLTTEGQLSSDNLTETFSNFTVKSLASLSLVDSVVNETGFLNTTFEDSDEKNSTVLEQEEVFESMGVNSTDSLREALLKIKIDDGEVKLNATNATLGMLADEEDPEDEEEVFRSMGVNSTDDLKTALLKIKIQDNDTLPSHFFNTTSRGRVFNSIDEEDDHVEFNFTSEPLELDNSTDIILSNNSTTTALNVTEFEETFVNNTENAFFNFTGDIAQNETGTNSTEFPTAAFNETEKMFANSTDFPDSLRNETEGTFSNSTEFPDSSNNVTSNETMGVKQKEMRLLWDDRIPKPIGHPAFIREVLPVDQSTVRMQMLLSQPLMEKLFLGDRTLLVLYTDRLSKIDGFNEWQRHDLVLQQNVAFVTVNGSEVGLETIITDLEPNRQYYFVVAREKEVNDPDMGLQFDDLSQVASTMTIKILDGTCEFMGKTLHVGERLNDECNTVCDCLPQQQMRCEAMLCMNQLPSDKTGCLEWEADRAFFPRPPHCCPAVSCKYGSMCTYKGHKFHNLEMIPSDLVDDCTLECKCVVGNVTCQQRCPPVPKEPPSDLGCEEPRLILVENDKCCQRWFCPAVPTTTRETTVVNDTTTILPTSESDTTASFDSLDEDHGDANTTMVPVTSTTELIFEQGMCTFDNVTYRLGDQWHVGEGHREQLCSCILLNNGSASPECQGGCRSIPEQYSALASDCPPQFLVIRDVPNLCPYVMCNKTDHGRGVTNLTAFPLNATSVRITFTIPNIYVGLFGHVEVLYTTELSQSEDTTNWNKEVFSGHGNLFEHAVISHELSNLQPDTVYHLKVLVILMDAQNMAASEVVLVHMPPTPTIEPSTTTTTLPPMVSLDAVLNFTEEQTTSAKVVWRSFDASEKRVIDGVRLKYKAKDDPDAQWSQTELIHRDVTTYTLANLRPDTVYDVDVIFVAPVNVSTEVLSTKAATFRTLPLIDKFEFNLTLRADKVTPYSVDLIWNGVPFPENKYVTVYRVQYKNTKSVKDDAEPRSMFRPPKGNQFQLTLENLSPNTSYDIWMDAYLLNGKTRSSVPVTAVTKPGPILAKASEKEKLESSFENNSISTGGSYYAALIVVAVIAALCGLGFVILLIILLRKQSTAKAPITNPKLSHTAYDNPTYKIYDNDVENGKAHT